MNVGGRQVLEEGFLLFFLLMSTSTRPLSAKVVPTLVPVAQWAFWLRQWLRSPFGHFRDGLPAPDEWILGFVIHSRTWRNERGTAFTVGSQ